MSNYMKALEGKIKVMNHFLNGGSIEWISKTIPTDTWLTWLKGYGEPSWNWRDFDYRIKKATQFRLPTVEEFDKLISHFSHWNDTKNGIEIENDSNEILFLPSEGYRYGSSDQLSMLDNEIGGYYWSSTRLDGYKYYAYILRFNSNSMNTYHNCSIGRCSVRLVSDTPFEGGIEFDGLYWKPENESGYFTLEEAIEKFNNVTEEKKIYYIKGSHTDPEGVKQALLACCPNVTNINDFSFKLEDDDFISSKEHLYYISDNKIGITIDDDHIELVKKFGIEIQPITKKDDQFRLPTKEEYDRLISHHFSRWNNEKKGLEIENDLGGILFFHADGYIDNGTSRNVDSSGYYWSSTMTEGNRYYAHTLYFHMNGADTNCNLLCNKRSVRLVSDTPFEGGIEFDGLYWKPENEDGFYTWPEAMDKFNKQ